MRITLPGLLIFLLIPFISYGQIDKLESTRVEGRSALKLITQRGNSYLVIAGEIGGENALILGVGHRHATDNCAGGLAITKSRVLFNSPLRPDHNFTLARSELKLFEINDWKSFGKVIYQQLAIKTKDKDYNFFPWAESSTYNSNVDDFPWVLMWISHAISNFDEGWKNFETAYSKNLPKGALIGPSGEKFSIQEHYDKFKDRTTYATSPMTLHGNHLGIVFQVFFASDGTKPIKPQHAVISVGFVDDLRTRLKSDRTLIFLVDNSRLRLGAMDWLESIYLPGGRYASGRVKDYLGMTIPWETLVRIANASTVEFQVETVEARLDSVHLEAIKMLIARAENSPPQ